MTAEGRISILEADNAQLRQQVKQLEEKVLWLIGLLEQKPLKKDSHNSHTPPSQDQSKRTKSLRKKSNRKPGGQKGHPGQTLVQKEEPDLAIDLKSNFCPCCGEDLPEAGQRLFSKRQVIEIPPVEPVYIEYRQFGCRCARLRKEFPHKHVQKADYPAGVNAPIQYGASVTAMISYLNVYQYIPFRRLKILFTDLFNLPLSEGSIANALKRASTQALPMAKGLRLYEVIRQRIESATQVGSDETGAKVSRSSFGDGDRWWIWVWQNISNTFLKASDNRGSKTIDDTFANGLRQATVGSDRWAAQLKTVSKGKQLCLPHLQRDLVWLEEKEGSHWASYFKQLLGHALDLRKLAEQQGCPYRQGHSAQAYKLEDRLNRLLARSIVQAEFPETVTFQKSMIKHRNFLFPFLYDLEVPPDNNGSERAIRNVKVKQKISGQFKSGQHAFCILRSVIDTLKKRNLDVFTYLSRIMNTPLPLPE